MTDAASSHVARRADAPAPRGRKAGTGVRLLGAAIISLVTILAFLCLSPEVRHWFVVPLLACRTLVFADALAWGCGELDLFDPVGLVGVLVVAGRHD